MKLAMVIGEIQRTVGTAFQEFPLFRLFATFFSGIGRTAIRKQRMITLEKRSVLIDATRVTRITQCSLLSYLTDVARTRCFASAFTNTPTCGRKTISLPRRNGNHEYFVRYYTRTRTRTAKYFIVASRVEFIDDYLICSRTN